MKLTNKDKEFLEKLSFCLKSNDLSVDLVDDGVKRLVLRQNYGDKIENQFKMSRQGVRWRFQRLFNDMYVSAYETIYYIESSFGVELRQCAIEIAKQRVQLRMDAMKREFSGKRYVTN